MYGLLASVPLFIWGYYSINAGINSAHFGPILGGAMCIFIALVLFMVSLIHLIDKTFPIRVGKGVNEEHSSTRALWSVQDTRSYKSQGQSWDELQRLNTPDPNLIHPDDAKRQARAQLDIKV